ncbi:hypothetical protein [Longimicrobium sp.]|uniref:hypothetical protein n=1 Tax=Longimicrobium sp. TaxID=2029185 RepID=UPI002BDD0008|nr:hypothetical protein [Longimicrobium sp.]HSU14010.1 hypothetical protein [Longimicrobium sp.]
MRPLCRLLRLACAALALVPAATACRGGSHAQSSAAHAGHAAVDWASVGDRDLNIASVFLVARDAGVRQALDSLSVLTRADPQLELQGHAIAHGLGRFAVARRGYDLAVFAECRPTFLSGCYHGVLEGYMSIRRAGDVASLRGACTSAAVRAMPPYAFRECAHGMGHGLMGVRAHDLFATLGDCDAVLPAGLARRECYDGAFMENVVHGMGTMDVNVGDAMAGHHAHAAADRKLLKADDPWFPCDSIAAAGHQPSCWAYQPVVFFVSFGGDMDRVVRACDRAPAASAAACFRGLGKQTMGRMPTQPLRVVRICRQAGAAYTGDCLAGAVEFFVDKEWKAEPAFAFCAQVPSAEKEGCYRAVGERLAWIDPAPAAIRAACAKAGDAYAAACTSAAESEHAPDVVAQAAAASPPPAPASPAPAHEHGTMHHPG